MKKLLSPKLGRLSLARWTVTIAFGLVLLAIGYAAVLRLTGNFHTVVSGQLYRSGQLTPAQIAQYARKYGIKTIINLRGGDYRGEWYNDELAEAHWLGIAHFDFPMSARRELTVPQARRLIVLMKAARKPILIHCQAGSDRSGLAAALYLAALTGAGQSIAREQLSIRFGHIPLPISPEFAMDRSFERLTPVIGSLGH